MYAQLNKNKTNGHLTPLKKIMVEVRKKLLKITYSFASLVVFISTKKKEFQWGKYKN